MGSRKIGRAGRLKIISAIKQAERQAGDNCCGGHGSNRPLPEACNNQMNCNGSAVGFHSTETLLDSACRLYITALSGKASTGKFSQSQRGRLSLLPRCFCQYPPPWFVCASIRAAGPPPRLMYCYLCNNPILQFPKVHCMHCENVILITLK